VIPWKARDSQSNPRSQSWQYKSPLRHQSPDTASEQVDALRVLEMQPPLMYTSLVLKNSQTGRNADSRCINRALELAEDVAGVQLEKGFLKRLAQAPSNVEFSNTVQKSTGSWC